MTPLIITVASRSGISHKFAEGLRRLSPTALVCIDGLSDVTLARNVQLTESEPLWTDDAVVLMIDDDIVIQTDEAQQRIRALIDKAVETQVPCSGLYVDKNGDPTACRLTVDKKGTWFRWLTGLGMIAIPVNCLRALKDNSLVVESRGKKITCYTCSGPLLNKATGKFQWSSEDYSLTNRLGGANLYPELSFGHLKPQSLEAPPSLIEVLNGIIAKS